MSADRWRLIAISALISVLGLSVDAQELPPASARLQLERDRLDQTVWAPEQLAQRYEASITGLWDRLRGAASAVDVLHSIQCDQWILPKEEASTMLGMGIGKKAFNFARPQTLNRASFVSFVSGFADKGYRLVASEFHHTSFTPDSKEEATSSTVGFMLHLQSSDRRLAVDGLARVTWSGGPGGKEIRASEIAVEQLKVLESPLRNGFLKAATFERRENEFQSAHPILVNDLDHDGDPEIIIPRWNRRYDNQLATEKPKLVDSAFLDHWKPQEECGLLADLNLDGQIDYITMVKNEGLTVYDGAALGRFPTPGRVIFTHQHLLAPMALTAGDIDADGDLDLFLSQYKPSYVGGQMPTPFYDANDGFPSFMLRNDGGRFVDVTTECGLGKKRNRRTYSASLVDLDRDGDLDLSVVSDYAGVDVYSNNGSGRFVDTSAALNSNRLFGMAQSVADYNGDGWLDLLAIGMSSSTARRLDNLRLGPESRKDYQENRAAMGYGNRLYLGGKKGLLQSPFNEQIARTGWSWGVSSFDFDNDGRRDLYISNGFRSGKSAKDYCSHYWTQDIYAGGSKENAALVPVFAKSMLALNLGQISWNGFEHNHLKWNLGGGSFADVAFLFGASFEYDARVAITEDFDGDGREDLLVSEYLFVGRGFQSKLHLYLNRSDLAAEPNDWIAFKLLPSAGQAILGAVVTIETSNGTQTHPLIAGDGFLSQDAFTAHFGLGKRAEVTKATIHWPGGRTLDLKVPQKNRVHSIRAEAVE